MSVVARHQMESSEPPFVTPFYGREAEAPGFVLKYHNQALVDKVQSPVTGILGLAMVILGAFVISSLHGTDQALSSGLWPFRRMIVLLLAFVAMAVYELVVERVHLRNFDFSTKRPLDDHARERIKLRCIASFLCLVLITCVFLFVNAFLSGFLNFYLLSLPVIIMIVPMYFTMVEQYARPEGTPDEMLTLGLCARRILAYLMGRNSREDAGSAVCNAYALNLLRSCIVKGIFVPVMFLSYLTAWHKLEEAGSAALSLNYGHAFGSLSWAQSMVGFESAVFYLFAATDLTIAVIGYIVSMRLFDNQFVSTEPTAGGWFAAIVCYPPFNALIELFVWSKLFYIWPAELFSQYPALSLAVTSVALIMFGIYSWCTVCFGMRFANLSNRGIIFHGPYKVIRHPAYAAKSLFWCCSLLPLLSLHPDMIARTALCLVALILIYVARAITEETHLGKDPIYRIYLSRVKHRFIPWFL